MGNTKQEIIEKAFLLFLKKGFKAVKLNDIEKKAGITKGTFYYHFTDKAEVLKEGLAAYYAMIDRRRELEFASITTLREYIDLTIKKMTGIHNYTARSFGSDIPEILCLSLIVEMISLFPELKKIPSVSKMQHLSKLEELILEAKKRGEIREDTDTSVLAKNILNISAGMINYLLMHQDLSYAVSSMRFQYEQLYALVTVK